eukprot:3312084-Pyramimonas_sp.AAC.1
MRSSTCGPSGRVRMSPLQMSKHLYDGLRACSAAPDPHCPTVRSIRREGRALRSSQMRTVGPIARL